ncbi:hypothetical protein KEM56_007196 [Ascosphaera pollenicola]|nr:hypothetical protein KEM56_007196 [Ascosphaera pollenicola]
MAPPADSSDDDFQGDIPARGNGKKVEKNDISGSDDDDDDDGDDEEEYIVEQILGHEWKDAVASFSGLRRRHEAKHHGCNTQGQLLFIVKWKGYDNPDDHTLEPEDNLENAQEAVKEYYSKIGGKPQKPEKKKRKSRASSAAADKHEEPEPVASSTSGTGTNKKARQSTSRASTTAASSAGAVDAKLPEWVPRTKSWEEHVESIDTIMRDPDDPTGPLFVYLNWTNGNKSRVSTEMANKKCPQKMLQFYEQHIVFKDGE